MSRASPHSGGGGGVYGYGVLANRSYLPASFRARLIAALTPSFALRARTSAFAQVPTIPRTFNASTRHSMKITLVAKPRAAAGRYATHLRRHATPSPRCTRPPPL